MHVQAEEVEDAEAMAEEGLLSAGKGPKPAAAGDAAGLSHCLYIAAHDRCTHHDYTSTPRLPVCVMPF
jgi:hypothetical protein